jgi:hypothetical protein
MQSGPRFLTLDDLNTLVNLTPSNVPANQPSTMHEQYGAIGQTFDGRIFRFVAFPGTTTIQPGLLLVQPAAATNSTGLAISATQPSTTATGSGATGASALAAGSLSFNVTNGATAVTQDEFGFVQILVSAGGTYQLKLRGNTLAAASGTITLYLAEPLPPTITTLIAGTDTVNLVKNEYTSPILATTTLAPVVGVTYVSVPQTSTAAYAGWVQTRGQAYVQATSGTVGYPVAQDVATNAGFVANLGAGAAETQQTFGVFKTAAASSAATVFLTID